MIELYKFYIHFYSNVSNILLTLILTGIVGLLFRIFFVRYNSVWKEYEYSRLPAILIIPVTISISPIISTLLKIQENTHISQIMSNINNNRLISFTTYSVITLFLIIFLIQSIKKPWWSIQYEKDYNKINFITILALNIITLFIFDIFLKSQFEMKTHLRTSFIVVIAQITILVLYNIYLYKKYEKEPS